MGLMIGMHLHPCHPSFERRDPPEDFLAIRADVNVQLFQLGADRLQANGEPHQRFTAFISTPHAGAGCQHTGRDRCSAYRSKNLNH